MFKPSLLFRPVVVSCLSAMLLFLPVVHGWSANAPTAATGQTTPYAVGDNGTLQQGVVWPNPRFTDNGDGTITDNLTGLTWLQDSPCLGYVSWFKALSNIEALNDDDGNAFNCLATNLAPDVIERFTDTSTDWRLPNINELRSLVNLQFHSPALQHGDAVLPDHPFISVQNTGYWTSTTSADNEDRAWVVDFRDGHTFTAFKSNGCFVWPVRGGVGAPIIVSNVETVANDASADISWNALSGAVSYNLYMATVPGVTAANYTLLAGGTQVLSVTSPHTLTGLTNDVTYYVVVTAIDSNGTESTESQEVSVTPVQAPIL